MKGFFIAIILLLFVAFSGCDKKPGKESYETGSLGGKCYSAGTCDEGLTCIDDICVNEDDSDPDKDAPDDEKKGEGDVGDQCVRHSDCKEPLMCINGRCNDKDSTPDKEKSNDEDFEPVPDEEPDLSDDTDLSDEADAESDDSSPVTDNDDDFTDDDTDDSSPVTDNDDESTDNDEDPDDSAPEPFCGDGNIDDGEECDHGGTIDLNCYEGEADCMRCNEECKLVPGFVQGYCGDGAVQDYLGEECDHGGFLNYYCALRETSCQTCGPECVFVPGIPHNYCGDGIVQSLYEECDFGFNNGMYGVKCNNNCEAVYESGFCGDETVQSPHEECDDGPLNGTEGSDCWTNCMFKGVCGDGVPGHGEICDGDSVPCDELSSRFQSGMADCLDDCLGYDTSACVLYDDHERYGVFYTGQKLCYDDNDALVFCPLKGERFYGQDSQYPCEEKIFEVSDFYLVTELNPMRWMVGSPTECSFDGGSKCTFEEATNYCINIAPGAPIGQEWRLPSMQELISAVNYGSVVPPLSFNNFNVVGEKYWTSSASISEGGEGVAYLVDFNSGSSVFVPVNNEMSARVICVSMHSFPRSSYEESCNNVITDVQSYLKWIRVDTLPLSWEGALSVCENSTQENHTFWRLPNINELATILNARGGIPASTMPGIGSEPIWSSTTHPVDNTKAMSTDTTDGTIFPAFKTDLKTVYCISDIPELLNCP